MTLSKEVTVRGGCLLDMTFYPFDSQVMVMVMVMVTDMTILPLRFPDMPPQLWFLVSWVGLVGLDLGLQQHHYLISLCKIVW